MSLDFSVKPMTKERLIELAPEIDALLNMPPDELDEMADQIWGEEGLSNVLAEGGWNRMRAWSICNYQSRNRRDYGKIHEVIHDYGLGHGGEPVVDILIGAFKSLACSQSMNTRKK